MRTRLALVLAPILLLAMLPGSVMAGNPDDTAADAAAAREHARVLAYWTPERIKNAKPRDFVRGASGFQPAARPSKPGGGGSGVVTGASYPNNVRDDVYRLVGRALFSLGGSDYICSGTVVKDSSASTSLVLTAGHCVMENDGATTAANWMFIPQFDSSPTYTCGSTAYGCWTGTRIYGDTEFYTAGGFNNQAVAHDWAFVQVGAGGKSNTQLDALGSFNLAAPGISLGNTVGAYGYPAAGKYKGKDLTYCLGPVSQDSNAANLTWGLACNMTGGSSGGGWITGDAKDDTKGVLVSLNSYGYSGLAYMFGPKFNGETLDAYAAAKTGATSGTGIVVATLSPRP
jgi:V8-like Glu-specific endopeptidase